MDRTKFYTKVTVDGVEQLDYLHHTLSGFKMKYEPSYYRVNATDLMRPDTISYKNYGTVRYWWLILYVNGIGDPFSELTLGQLLQIPNLIDVYNFYKKYKLR